MNESEKSIFEYLTSEGLGTDHDSGGFVVSEIAENPRICIAEKSAKVANVRSRYSEWWLAFEDRFGYGRQ